MSTNRTLEGDGFVLVGRITFQPPSKFKIDFSLLRDAESWAQAIYAFRIGRKVVRIGKAENLKVRIDKWNDGVPRALGGEFHKGGTNPWEAFQWRTGLTKHGQGEFWAQRVKENLLSRERELIKCYDPPLCNDSPCARPRPPWARSVRDAARAEAYWKLLLGPFEERE